MKEGMMKKLIRPTPAPSYLSSYCHLTNKWSKNSPTSEERLDLWEKLYDMQKGYCCYCESIAKHGEGHIEHFFHKGQNPDGSSPYKHLTFDWDNLFASCGHRSGDTCGHYKDREGPQGPGNYDPNKIIKPDVDNPLDYFEFLPTGTISIKSGLPANKVDRAEETLRVLNLQHLNGRRNSRIDIYNLNQ